MSDPQTITATGQRPARIAYVMSRFPKISETFVLYEIVELERLGAAVEIFPLIREREQVSHPEAAPLVRRAHYSKPQDGKVLAAQAYWLRRAPGRYLAAWAAALWGNRSSPKFLSRAIVATLQGAWFARRMSELEIEHIHAHFATHGAMAAYAAHRLTGIPYSFTAHADDIYLDQSMLEEKIRQASFVATISDYNRRFLRQLYGHLADEKVAVVHCGVDVAVFEPRQAPPPRDTFLITCVARLEEKKGHSYLIDACARLRDRGLAFECRLIGDGELREALEARVARLNLGEHVKLLGRRTRDEVRAMLAESDAMVLPSITAADRRQEGIPVALMEAMATELPVIASAISGIPELVEHGRTGLLVPERNAEALANAIQLLADNPAVGRALGAAGRTKVLSEFNLRSNTEALYRHFQQAGGAPASQLPALEEAR